MEEAFLVLGQQRGIELEDGMDRDFGPIPPSLIDKSFFFFFIEHILFVHTISEDTDTVILFVG